MTDTNWRSRGAKKVSTRIEDRRIYALHKRGMDTKEIVKLLWPSPDGSLNESKKWRVYDAIARVKKTKSPSAS